jgi:hypothetical protein
MPNTEVGRAVWATLETQRQATLDDVQEFAGLDPSETLVYLNTLIQQKYVAVRFSGRADSGESVCMFYLARFTGPEAPYVDETGQFIDPNLQRHSKRNNGRNGRLADGERPPSPSARIMAAARRLNKFTRAEILEETGLANENAHSSAYLRGLSNRGWLYRLGRNEWRLAGTPPEAQIVESLLTKAAGGEPIDMIAAHRKWGSEIPQRTIGFVVDVMRAEGWKITKGPGAGKTSRMIYQVENRA